MGTKIKINFFKKDKSIILVEIDSENPALDDMISKVTQFRDDLDILETRIIEYPDNFDHEEFKNVLILSFKSYLEIIAKNEKDFSDAFKTIPGVEEIKS